MRLNVLTNVFTTRWREPVPCPACGSEFICGATITGCWCTAPKLSDDVRVELKRRFTGCLCETCLDRLASGEAVDALARPKALER